MLAPNALTQPDATFSKIEPEPPNAATLTCNTSKEGSVLLSSDGRIIKLNSIGSLVWEILYSNEKGGGVTEDELSNLLIRRFEPSLHSSFARESILNDLKQFLFTLRERRLISVSADATGTSVFRIVKDTIWSGQHHHRDSCLPGSALKRRVNRATTFERFMTLRALFWLLAYSFLLTTGGFRTVRRIVERSILQSTETRDVDDDREILLQICRAVDRAQTYLLRQALCLQRSIVITKLLQDRGLCAETVIAAHMMPFKSHAWVEINGEVVSDSPNVKRYYDVVVERLSGPTMTRGDDR